jgi:hypothetical protein
MINWLVNKTLKYTEWGPLRGRSANAQIQLNFRCRQRFLQSLPLSLVGRHIRVTWILKMLAYWFSSHACFSFSHFPSVSLWNYWRSFSIIECLNSTVESLISEYKNKTFMRPIKFILQTAFAWERCLKRNRHVGYLRSTGSQENNGFTLVWTSLKGHKKIWSGFRRNMCQYKALPSFTEVGITLILAVSECSFYCRRVDDCSLACRVHDQLYVSWQIQRQYTKTQKPMYLVQTFVLALSYITHVCLHCHCLHCLQNRSEEWNKF